jgi:GNAT superfamily N-acetyltransferase
MVADTLKPLRVDAGLRPLNPARDLAQVAALMELAFGAGLDPLGQAILQEMRRLRGGRLTWLAVNLTSLGQAVPPGFVWLVEGRVVGNVSIRPADTPGGWLIGNLAVHPEYRRRGLGRTLMDAAIGLAETQHGRWVALQVETSNESAIALYRSMGFQAVGTLTRWRRPPEAGTLPAEATPVRVRPRRAGEWWSVYQLARAVEPLAQTLIEPLRPDELRPGIQTAIVRWLEGVDQRERVAEVDGALVGAGRTRAPGALAGAAAREARVELYVHPDWHGPVECPLLAACLAPLGGRRLPVRVDQADGDAAAEAALQACSFTPVRALTTMRLSLVV